MGPPRGPPRSSVHFTQSHQPDERPTVRVDVRTEEVNDSTESLFTTFLTYQLQRDGHNVPQCLAERQRIQSATARELQRIGDRVNDDATINHCIAQLAITSDTAYESFASVASKMFQDDVINWGRIVMLFIFASKLAVRVIENKLTLLPVIISWVARFVMDKLASWIALEGGWGAIFEFSGASIAQTIGVFLAGVALSTFIVHWRK